jgi:hypothetical protein
MGKLFSLDRQTKQVISDALDDFLVNNADGGLAKSCLLVYPSTFVECPNCVRDPIGGKSANRPRSGAPVPFTAGQPCPVCSGKGQKEVEQTEEITLKCNWEPKTFVKVANLDVRVPYSLVETKGFLTDLPKILKADHLVVNLPIASYLRQKFRLEGEPGDPGNIIQGRYFTAVWRRWNG